MKICTITCNNADNYGARLQAYALQTFLESLGHEVRVIDYEPDYVRFNTRLWYIPGFDLKEWIKLIIRYKQRKLTISKHLRLEEFSQKYLHLTQKYHSLDQLRANPPEADIYIAGSDQIWNTSLHNGLDKAYYLDFGDKSIKRISYAASFAIPYIPELFRDLVSKRLDNFDVITVRESSAINIVNNLIDGDPKLVCDPVFLHDAEFWTNFADNTGFDEKYVLVYDFESSDAIRRAALQKSQKYGLKIYSASPRPLNYADRNFCDCKVESFVGLIKNATHVVCNSLHGIIFSKIFNKPFTIVDRVDGLNQRMYDFKERYILDNNDTLNDDIALSKHFLRTL